MQMMSKTNFFKPKTDSNNPKKILGASDDKYIEYKKDGDEKQSSKQYL